MKVHETVWHCEESQTLDMGDTELLALTFRNEGKTFTVSIAGPKPLMLKQAINAFRAGVAKLCLENGIEIPDARYATAEEMPGDGTIN